jgi:glycosyltransferase involved in cell wall biosynthesis
MGRKSVKICFFTTYFYPEEFKGNDIAFELSKRGYLITVVTNIPNYSGGKYYKGYSLFKRNKEIINNVTVIRLPVIPRGNGSKLRLILNYLSYLVFSLCFTFFFMLFNRFDVVFVQQLSPFFVGIPAVMMSKKQKIPLYFWVLDLWPESVQSAGGFNNKLILAILNRMVIGVYNNCTKILIGSQGYEKSILQKGNFCNKLVYFPNWAENIDYNPKPINPMSICPFSTFTKKDLIFLFAGNIGEAQNIDAFIETAKTTKEQANIKWVFLGDGRCRNFLKNLVVQYGLEHTVFFPGRFPIDTMPEFMGIADVLLVSLKNELIFNLTVPSKVQFYMAQGKPILAMLNGDGAELIANAQCGYCAPAGNYEKCADLVYKILDNKEILSLMGKKGKDYYLKHFQKKDRIDQLENIINIK